MSFRVAARGFAFVLVGCAGGSVDDAATGTSAVSSGGGTGADSGASSVSSSGAVTNVGAGGAGGVGGAPVSGTGGVGGAAPSGASGVGGAASSSTSGGGLPATCVTDDAIACGGVVTGNAKGEDATIDKYGSTCLGWGATYEDRLWSFSTSTSKTVTAKVTASSGADDFDLLVLEGSCNPDACIDKSVNIGTDAVTFTAKAGVPYVIAVEFNGYQSSLGGYELTVICD